MEDDGFGAVDEFLDIGSATRMHVTIKRKSGSDRPIVRDVRLLGDNNRGYLLVGLAGSEEGGDEEFWFRTLDAAIASAAVRGISPSSWRDMRANRTRKI
jgi:hypothetical protein